MKGRSELERGDLNRFHSNLNGTQRSKQQAGLGYDTLFAGLISERLQRPFCLRQNW